MGGGGGGAIVILKFEQHCSCVLAALNARTGYIAPRYIGVDSTKEYFRTDGNVIINIIANMAR